MKKPYVFIISQFFEPNVDAVISRLNQRGVSYFRLNTETIPLITTISLYEGAEELYTIISCDGKQVDTRCITSVWRRRNGEFVYPNVSCAQERGFIRHESASMLHGAFESMRCSWVNHFMSDYRANVKPYQYEIAKQVGLTVSRTLITNDPDAVKEFARSLPVPVLFKPVIGLTTGGPPNFSAEIQATYDGKFNIPPAIPESRGSEVRALFSQVLDDDKIKHLNTIAGCPAIFQEYIKKRVEIRITIIGNDMFPVEIHSQDREDTKVDFRAQTLLETSQFLHHEVHKLPDDISAKLMKLMKELNLVFGCVDMILTPNGEYVFLEVNTAGQWGWIEHLTGLKITDALTDLLIRGSIDSEYNV
ncbi:MAG: hypothetical protein M1330_02815 [Armatimonadetes bacterium]|nr:hypothetical protein [Armatimonadota bacterium]